MLLIHFLSVKRFLLLLSVEFVAIMERGSSQARPSRVPSQRPSGLEPADKWSATRSAKSGLSSGYFSSGTLLSPLGKREGSVLPDSADSQASGHLLLRRLWLPLGDSRCAEGSTRERQQGCPDVAFSQRRRTAVVHGRAGSARARTRNL